MAAPRIRDRETSASAPWLAFVAGVVLVAAVIAAFMLLTADREPRVPARTVNIEVNPPKLPDINLPDAPRLPTG